MEHSGMKRKEWVTRPFPRSTFLSVVHQYVFFFNSDLITIVFLSFNCPRGFFKTENSALVSTRKSIEVPSTFRITLGLGRGSGSSLPIHLPWLEPYVPYVSALGSPLPNVHALYNKPITFYLKVDVGVLQGSGVFLALNFPGGLTV